MTTIALGQKKDWQRFGNEAFKERDYYGASKFFYKLYKQDSSNIELTYKLALSYKGYNNFPKAEYYLKKVYQSTEQASYPDVIYWLGIISKNQEKYDEALKYFKEFKKKAKDKRSIVYLRARNEIKNYGKIKKLLEDSVDLEIKNLGEKINTGVAEFGSVVINDSTLLFTSLRADKMNEEGVVEDAFYTSKIYLGEKEDSTWKLKRGLKELTQSGYNIANGCFNSDKSVFYYSVCSEGGFCSIYKAKHIGGEFSEPAQLGPIINMEGTSSTQPFWFEQEGVEYLLFVSNRPRGKGGMDIWVAQKKRGKWFRPKNLGSKINTKGNEVSPFYDSKKKELYFSSDWHYNLGGFDVFKSKGGIRSLQFVTNLGRPFNSSVNDLYFTPVDSLKGFLTSTREGSISDKDAVCCNDLFSFNKPQVEKKDTDTIPIKEEVLVRLQKLIEEYHVTLYFHNDEPNPRSWDTVTQYNYVTKYNEYKKLVPKYRKEFSKRLNGQDSLNAVEEIDEFFLNYVDRGMEDLRIFSDELLKELEAGYKIELTVKGYASPLAKSDYNVNLTLRRISSMQNYLREHKNGVYVPYLEGTASNGGRLKIKKVPFGEYKSDSLVSDDYYDQRNSVYNRKAALERKIEIININLFEDSTKYEFEAFADTITYNFGKQDSAVFEVPIILTNKKSDTLIITEIIPDCHCTTTNLKETKLLPGEKSTLKLKFEMGNEKGSLGRRIRYKTSDGKEHVIEVLFEL